MSEITDYSRDKSVSTLDRGSYGDFSDGTPAKQVQLCSETTNSDGDKVVRVLTGAFVFGVDYDTVEDSFVGLVQTIVLKKGVATFKTITITYTNECRDQYTAVIA